MLSSWSPFPLVPLDDVKTLGCDPPGMAAARIVVRVILPGVGLTPFAGARQPQ